VDLRFGRFFPLAPHAHTQHMPHDTRAHSLWPAADELLGAAQRIGEVVERHYKGDALTMAIQDGAAAGQTVSTHARFPGWPAQPSHLTVLD
jgi:diadenosine tetraphosphate (Ap4A) HIT family hydrolase